MQTLHIGGIGISDVELVRIESPGVDVPEERLEAAASVKGADLFPDVAAHQSDILSSGNVDALFTWLPWAAELEDLSGARVLADLGDDKRNRYASVWTVSAQLVDERPDLVQRLVDAAVQAGRWAQAHPRTPLASMPPTSG